MVERGGRTSREPSVAAVAGRGFALWPGISMTLGCLRSSDVRLIQGKCPEHKVNLRWERGAAEFVYQKYPRDHTWSFDGGHTMTASAGPPIWAILPTSIPKKLSSPHFPVVTCSLFLAIACKQK